MPLTQGVTYPAMVQNVGGRALFGMIVTPVELRPAFVGVAVVPAHDMEIISGPERRPRMANFLYVDNSNVWIEGMHVAAVASGLAPDIWTAQKGNICDYGWKLDFGRLLDFAGGA